ncbi:unnamed protein product, partial [Allacma fusca]
EFHQVFIEMEPGGLAESKKLIIPWLPLLKIQTKSVREWTLSGLFLNGDLFPRFGVIALL